MGEAKIIMATENFRLEAKVSSHCQITTILFISTNRRKSFSLINLKSSVLLLLVPTPISCVVCSHAPIQCCAESASFNCISNCVYCVPKERLVHELGMLVIAFPLPSDCDHINPATCDTCSAAIDTLIDAFTESVSEYLTGESAQSDSSSYAPPTKELCSQPQRKGLERAGIKGFSKSHDNLVSKFNSYSTANLSQQFNDSSEWMWFE